MNANGKGTSGSEISLADLARRLGTEAAEKAREQAAEVIHWERIKREKQNEAEIRPLKHRGAWLLERREELKEFLQLAPFADLAGLRRRRVYHWSVAIVLSLAGIFFAHLALAPFGLGWETWMVSVGIGIVCAFCTDKTLENIKSEKLIRVIYVVALMCSLGGLLVLAILRGDILTLYLKNATASGLANDLTEAGNGADFYGQAIWRLRVLMCLLAVAMELASGMALFQAMKVDLTSPEAVPQAKQELQEIESAVLAVDGRIAYLESEAAIHEADFYTNFYLGMMTHIKHNGLIHMVLICGLALSLFLVPIAHAQNGSGTGSAANDLSVVIAIDLTQSVAGKGYDGKTEYEKNIEGASKLISGLPPGSRATVLAITDRSFSQPYVLLKVEIPRDKGPLEFQDRIAITKMNARAELRQLAGTTPPNFSQTDIFGALLVAAEILKESKGQRVLILFTDMRQSTSALDIERPGTVDGDHALRLAEREKLLADLQGDSVYVLGVDASGKTIGYWNSLHDFWVAYFKRAGANLESYSILRELPDSAPLR